MTPKQNFLECIRFGNPRYVALGNEPISVGFQLDGNFRMENWTDHWGVGWEVGLADTVPFPKHNPLPSLDRLDDFVFPDPDALLLTDHHRHLLESTDRRQALIFGDLTYLLFERAWAIMGMENFLTALVTHPDAARRFLHGIADYARRVFDRYLALDVDGISFSEDLGTQRALMVSPQMFRGFILPEYEYCFERVLSAGKIINFHSCGCIDAVAADLAAIGVTVLNPVQARANDLAVVKDATTGRMALQGAIDTAVLARGSTDDVRAEVARVMRILKPGGGWICTPDQSIPGISQENYNALWDAGRDLGRY